MDFETTVGDSENLKLLLARPRFSAMGSPFAQECAGRVDTSLKQGVNENPTACL